MADFSPWGPMEMGSRVLEKDQQAAALNALAIGKGLSDIQLQQAHIPLYEAQANKLQTEARRLGREDQVLAQLAERRAARAAAGTLADDEELDTDERVIRDLYELADTQIAMGKLNEASLTMNRASQVNARGYLNTSRVALAEKAKTEAKQKQLQMVTGLWRGVQSQEDQDAAAATATRELGFRPAAFDQPYSPEAVARNIALGQSEVDRERERHNAQMEGYRDRAVRAREAEVTARRARIDQAIRESEWRMNNNGKAGARGGRVVGPANEQSIKDGTAIVRAEFPGIEASGQEMRNLVSELAGEASVAANTNPGTSWDAEFRKALERNRDKITPARPPMVFAGITVPGTGTPPKIAKRGAAEGILPWPTSPKSSDFVKGKVYNTPRGPAKYLGDGKFESVGE